ncbi:hypothetical protein O9K51_06725 [Purpureocillium lavendulum]|uniref:Uncharacterized protein n=1 Tax=Purpureocillium lavendulum TaxID=1247861 RepID=A0AB34FP42_9HYPO|nr:hypothetical protein O9K51_06725 [Purpureocillium lavendulum]
MLLVCPASQLEPSEQFSFLVSPLTLNMSLSNDNQLLDLVAFAARFPKETRHWDPRIAILDELNDIVTCAESDKGIDPTDELPTKESLDTRLKHLDNSVSRTPLRTLDVKDTCSPSDDLELVKHYLTRLKYEYKKRRKESASAEFRFPENSPESDVKTVGVWIAARAWGLAFPATDDTASSAPEAGSSFLPTVVTSTLGTGFFPDASIVLWWVKRILEMPVAY